MMQGAPVDPATGMPMDPTMMQGAPPDPSAGMPMDPAMMQGAPPDPSAGMQDPAMLYEMMLQAVRQVMEESGGTGGKESKKPKKPSVDDRIAAIERALSEIGIPVAAPEDEDNASSSEKDSDDKQQQSSVMGPAAGQPAGGNGALPVGGPLGTMLTSMYGQQPAGGGSSGGTSAAKMAMLAAGVR
jgi:hypothetical protein